MVVKIGISSTDGPATMVFFDDNNGKGMYFIEHSLPPPSPPPPRPSHLPVDTQSTEYKPLARLTTIDVKG